MQNYITLLKSFVLDRYTVQILENHSIFSLFIIEISTFIVDTHSTKFCQDSESVQF